MSENILNLSKSDFKNTIDSGEKPTLVDFWAPWCGPCRMLAPVLNEVADEVKGKANIAKVNVDEEPELAKEYGISSIPNVIIFKKGKPLRQLIGLQDKKTILAALS